MKVNDWIKVSERLPDSETLVLVNIKARRNTVTVGELRSWFGSKPSTPEWRVLNGLGINEATNYEAEVTHWMPLPQNPTN